ncbi:MAG: T9SS type A sorting domain-containing protein [Chitinophagales bacterium]|nr:T9SS type A sorting domain-containing protein [Chitinophagales bacterium]
MIAWILTKMQPVLLVLLLVVGVISIPIKCSAQLLFQRTDSIEVNESGKTLRDAWMGGLNNPQFSPIDLNNDGIEDLVVFNRGSFNVNASVNGNKILTYQNMGTANQLDYVYAPQFQSAFPGGNMFMLMRDFNCDSLADIVTYGSGQITLHIASYNASNDLEFSPASSFYFNNNGLTPIIINSLDIPAIIDVNNDGDVDVLTFEMSSAAYVNYYENLSQELTGTCNDTLVFERREYCWGQFSEDAASSTIAFNVTCPQKMEKEEGGPRHLGSTLCAFDEDGDGDKELILGDLSSLGLVKLTNGGTPANALMVAPADMAYPSYDVSVNLPLFPVAFHFDVNNDGRKDLIAAPNAPQSSHNAACAWYYENVSQSDTVKLEFRTDSFLVNESIDLGEGAYPTTVDVNGDGLLDLVVGNTKYYITSNNHQAGLAYFQNTGTASNPQFELIDRDYLNTSLLRVSNQPIKSIAPAFGDLDGDGDKDLLLGDDSGILHYFQNNAGSGNPLAFAAPQALYASIDAGSNSVPFIYDVNGDQLPDLLIGGRSGSIYFYENRGTASNPIFNALPTNNFFGKIDVRAPQNISGYCTPSISTLDSTGQLYVLVGNEDGKVLVYALNRDSIYGGAFNKVQSFYSDIDEGERSAPTVGRFSNDGKLAMIVGNYRGGLTFYSQTDSFSTSVKDSPEKKTEDLAITLYPNPADDVVYIKCDVAVIEKYLTVEVFDLMGKSLVLADVANEGTYKVNVTTLSAGVYICLVRAGSGIAIRKLVIH